MTDSDDIPQSELGKIQRSLGRIEEGLEQMKQGISDAIADQKAVNERVDKVDTRVTALETWRGIIVSRHTMFSRVGLLLLLPTISWTVTIGKYAWQHMQSQQDNPPITKGK
jgi:hypothetical protein